MKRRMKSAVWVLLLFAESFSAYSQSIEIRGGETLFPGVYAGIRYSHYSNSPVNLAGGLFMENSFKNNLRYSVYGADILAEYAARNSGYTAPFSYKAALGGGWQIENEPWVYRDTPFTQRMNYGPVAELSGEWMMTQTFGLAVFVQQKFLFNRDLGNTRFVFGLGLSYHFSQN